MIIIFRTDGGKAKEIGTGHITKTLLLASAIKERPFFEGSEIIFATRNDKTYVFGKERIDEAGYKHLDMTLSETNTITEKNILTSVRPDLVIFDRLCTSKSLVEGLKSKGIKVITFDDEGDGRYYSDITINALFLNVKEENNVFKGHKYLVTENSTTRKHNVKDIVERIFVCFGGYDYKLYTQKFLKIIVHFPKSIVYDVVVGDQNNESLNEISNLISELKNLNYDIMLHQNTNDFIGIMCRADIAITAGGLTAFTALLYGIPCISVAQYEHQKDNLTILSKKNAILLAELDSRSNHKIIFQVSRLIKDKEMRTNLFFNAKCIIDGKGMDRVISKIISLMHNCE
jgi:UDP-2,4-diacetamido-2,4,6-trideoxy-beta-L-altropyranose hydrolase